MNRKTAENICLVSPSLKVGGIERALVVLANFFAGSGYKVSFVSCLAGEHFYQLDERITLIEPDFRRSANRLNKLVVPGFIYRPRRTYRP